MAPELPDEVWQSIFRHAIDDALSQHSWQPTIMAECAWFNVLNEWLLRTPQKAIGLVHRRGYITKKVRTFTYLRELMG
jgi:hypothetical protein